MALLNSGGEGSVEVVLLLKVRKYQGLLVPNSSLLES